MREVASTGVRAGDLGFAGADGAFDVVEPEQSLAQAPLWELNLHRNTAVDSGAIAELTVEVMAPTSHSAIDDGAAVPPAGSNVRDPRRETVDWHGNEAR